MTKNILYVTLFTIIFFTSCNTYESIKTADHLVFIGIDAMSPDGIRNAPTPVIDSLILNGSHTFTARAVLPTVSSVNWFSMISGSIPEISGVTANAWRKNMDILPSLYYGADAMFPTIFSVIRDARPDSEIGVIYHWEGFNNLFERNVPNYDVFFPTEVETAVQAAMYLRKSKPLFTFINIDHVDIVGHEYGHGSPEYYASIALADSLLGIIVNALQETGMSEKTVIIITSDHGGIGYGHGGETIKELEIPFIITGKGIKRGFEIKKPVNLYDIPATALQSLGIETPDFWTGRPVQEVFESTGNEGYRFTDLLAVPSARPSRGVFYNQSVPVTLSTLSENAQIRYTLDGTEPAIADPVYTNPIILDRTATIRAATFREDNAGKSAEFTYHIIDPDAGHGVAVSYLTLMDSYIKDGAKKGLNLLPAKQDTVYQFNLHRLEMGENPAFILELKSFLSVDEDNDYTFYLSSANPSLLIVNRELVLKNPGRYNTSEEQVTISLKKGFAELNLMYYSLLYGKTLKLEYASPSFDRIEIPASRLYVAP